MKIELIDNTFLDFNYFAVGILIFLALLQNLENYTSHSTHSSQVALDLLDEVNHKLDIILDKIK
jgi:hypothetical protein